MFYQARFAGELRLGHVHRGAQQSAYLGYWIDERCSGLGLTTEGVVGVLHFGFDYLGLHRVQVSIVPRNERSLRVVSKLGLRCEGIAERYIEINGIWEDHFRFAITAEEWRERCEFFEGLTSTVIAPYSRDVYL